MNVAGPSRVRPAPRGRVESTYEDDLLGLLDHLTLDDMDEMQTFFARTGGTLSDQDIAMNDLLEQARALAVFNEDRVLARRIAAGEDVPEQAPVRRPVVALPAIGNRIANQRNADQQIQQRAGDVARNDNAQAQTWGGWFSSIVGWVFGPQPASKPGPTNPNTAAPTAPRPQVTNRPTGHNCVICQDPIYGAEIRAPCGHHYGIDCVTDLFQSATRDETLFPPRCCRQNIPFAQVQPHLSQALVTIFQEKQVEFGTLKRIYCSSPTCSRFLGPLHEGFSSKVYTCPAPGCGRRTCGKCREQHSGDWTHNCRPDADASQVLALGRAAGWARCPGCSQMIELHIGCYHMTCRCRTEFCYLCRARWKTCQCPQWDERRLLAVAEERVDAQLGVGRERGARRDVPAQQAGPVPAVAPANRVHVAPYNVRPVVPALALALAPAPPPPPRLPPRPAPAPTPAPVRFGVPTLASTAAVRSPRPPVCTPAASSSTARPANVTATSPRDELDTIANWRNSVASASNSTSAVASGSGWRPKGLAQTSASTSTSISPLASGSTLSPTSTSASASGSGWRRRLASVSASSPTSTSASALASGSGPGSKLVSASASTSASTSTPGSGWRSRLASTSTAASTSTSTPASSFARPKSMHNTDPLRQRLVREMMDRLREDHECDHGRWRYRNGGGVCQSCGHHLPLYLFRCQGCEMLACNRCRRNRL